MSNSWFQFKQFLVSQEKSALRVGTDGVLLGAWCRVPDNCEMETKDQSMEQGDTENGDLATRRLGDWGTRGLGTEDWRLKTGDRNPELESGEKETGENDKIARILDVGTGTGVVALMLAQRSVAQIHAIEINKEACEDAANNFRNSPWKERLVLFPADFNDFCQSDSNQYDLVVSNPPFFKRSLKSADSASAMARHDVSLSFMQLISGAKKLLNKTGRLAVIIPIEAFDDFRETARLCGFYLSRKTVVIPKTGKIPKRVLLEFSVAAVYPTTDELVILVSNGQYSGAFKELTNEFYLNSL